MLNINELKRLIKEEVENVKDVYSVIKDCNHCDIVGEVADFYGIDRDEACDKLEGFRVNSIAFEIDDKLYRYSNIDDTDPEVFTIERTSDIVNGCYLLKSTEDYHDFIYDVESEALIEIFEIPPYCYYYFDDGGYYGSDVELDLGEDDVEVSELYCISDQCSGKVEDALNLSFVFEKY